MAIGSEGEARQHMLSIFPEADIRQKCLVMFAEAIDEANRQGRDTWAVTHATGTGRKVRLIVGHLIVCTLGNGRLWMALDKGLLETPNHRSLLAESDDWEWGTGRYAEYRQIPSRNGYYRPLEEHSEIWDVIQRLHFESIFKAASQTTMDPRTPGRHSPVILEYLRNELGRRVPDPLY